MSTDYKTLKERHVDEYQMDFDFMWSAGMHYKSYNATYWKSRDYAVSVSKPGANPKAISISKPISYTNSVLCKDAS